MGSLRSTTLGISVLRGGRDLAFDVGCAGNSDPSLNLKASGLDEEVTPEIPRKPSSAAATLSAYDARDS